MRCSGRRCAMPTSDRVNGVTPAGLAREPTRIWPLSKGYPLQAVALARRSCDATVGCGLEGGGRDHLGLGRGAGRNLLYERLIVAIGGGGKDSNLRYGHP
jgi:hypothetical protein